MGFMQVEYCQDTGSFCLDLGPNMSVKKFTMLIDLSNELTASNCGTDVFDAT